MDFFLENIKIEIVNSDFEHLNLRHISNVSLMYLGYVQILGYVKRGSGRYL